MRIVNSTWILEERFGLTEGVRMLCEAGFEGIDFCMCSGLDRPIYQESFRETIRAVRDIAGSYGAVFSQTHGPIPKYQLDDRRGREEFLTAALHSVEATAELGAPHVVLHPMRVARGTHAEQLEINLTEYAPILDAARKCGVKLAFENMCNFKVNEAGEPVAHVCKSPEEHARYIDAFGNGVIACLDTGHAVLSSEEPCEFVRTLGSRLGALHVHDNGGTRDDHTVPYNMSIKFDPFIAALADIGYSGDITLECNYFIKPPYPSELCAAALRYMAAVADYIRKGAMKK